MRPGRGLWQNRDMIMITVLVASLAAVPASASAGSDAAFLQSAAAVTAQMSAAFARASWNEEDALLDLLRDRDAEVRRQAVRSLKGFVGQRSSTRDRVLDLYKDGREDLAVRREAARTLSAVSGYSQVYDALLDGAERGTDPGLRAVSYKALYWTAAQRSDVRDRLLDAARREPVETVRRAAIWALFNASGDNRVQDQLMDLVRRDPSEAVRDEALRSLYGAMGHNDVRDFAYRLAEREPSRAVRRTAILLHAFRVESRQADLLEVIAARDADAAMRAAAILALGRPQDDEIFRHFHLPRRDRHGVLIREPLDDE